MSAFHVTVRTENWTVKYPAIAQTSVDAICDAIQAFGLAAVTATPLREVNDAL